MCSSSQEHVWDIGCCIGLAANFFEPLEEARNIQQGVGWPALFYHAGHDLGFLLHGDDGDDDAHAFLARVLDEQFEYRVDGTIGPDAADGTILNRIIGFNKSTGTVSYEADPRHAEHLVKALKLENGKPVSTPAEKQKLNEVLAAEGMPGFQPKRPRNTDL